MWARKKEKFTPAPAAASTSTSGAPKGDRRMLLGSFLQQGIVAYYSYLTGRQTEWRDRKEYHPIYPFMAYSVDAVVTGERRGVDAKCVSWDQSWKWGPTAEEIPPYVVMQAWWYMAALDYPAWDIAALVAGEDEPRIYTIDRDLEVEKVMLEKAEEWWRRYLIGDERPPITGSESSHQWLKRTFPRHQREDIRKAEGKQIALLDDYARVYRQFDAVDNELKRLEAEVKQQIGEHEGLRWPGGQVTWKLSKDSAFIEWQKLAEELIKGNPEAPRLMKEHTQKKEGSRRLYFRDRRNNDAGTDNR